MLLERARVFLSTRAAIRLSALAAVAAVLLPVLAGDTFFYSDYGLIYHPLVRWWSETLGSGQAPWWNPDVGLGVPQVANPILGAFYPPSWLLLVLPFTWGLNLLVAAHVGLAVLGTALLVRRLGGDRFAELLGGTSFGLSGALVSSTSYVFPVFAWAWVPIVLLGAAKAVAGERGLALLATSLALVVLAGSPLAAVMAVGLSAVLLLGLRAGRGAYAVLGAGALLALCLAAVQILPAVCFLPESVRAHGAGDSTTWSFAPQRLVAFLLPDFFGRWAPEYSFWGQYLAGDRNDGNFFYYSHYAGVIPLVLAPAALLCQRTRRLALALAVGGVLALFLSFGRHTPVYGWVASLPGFGLFRYPEKWLMPVMLVLCLLGAMGLGAIRAEAGRAARIGALVAAGTFAIAGVVVLLAAEPLEAAIRSHAKVPIEDVARRLQVGGAVRLLVLCAAGAAAAWLAGRWRWLVPALAVVAALDVAVAARSLVWTTDPGVLEAGAPLLAQMRATGGSGPVARHPDLDRVQLHRDIDGLAATYRRGAATLRANFALEVGGRTLGAETPAQIAHPLPPDAWLFRRPSGAAAVIGVRYLLVPAGAGAPGGYRRVASLDGLGADVLAPDFAPPWREDPGFCIDAVVPVETEIAGDAVLSADPLQHAVVEPAVFAGEDPSPALALLHGSGSGASRCARMEDGHIEVDTERPSLLVLPRAFAGGWEAAAADGETLPIVRAYGSLQAIPVPAGVTRLRMEYAPPGLLAGALVSGLSLLLLVASAVRRRKGVDDRAGFPPPGIRRVLARGSLPPGSEPPDACPDGRPPDAPP